MSSSWETDLFDCFSVKDSGPLCCFNHCCCGLCIWTDSLVKAEIPNAKKYGVSMLFGAILSSAGSASDSAVLQGIGAAQETTSAVSGRNALAKKYGIEESTFNSIFARCCCPLCGQIQEVNTVMVREGYNYGCISLVPDPNFSKKPKPGKKSATKGRKPIAPKTISRV